MNQDVTISDGNQSDDDLSAPVSAGLTLTQFEEFHKEVKAQPPWRTAADREADYLDGNQLGSDILTKQQALGIPPAIEPLMGPALAYVCGQEAKLRRNWRVVPTSDSADDDVAEAMNVKLNEAERHSKADKACSNAFRPQAGVGVGWVEVSRDPNPFNYPYRAVDTHRNEIWYDWKGSRDPSMLDHRYLIRRRWTDKEQAKLLFPDQAKLIEGAATRWQSFEQFTPDGGHSTGLQMSVHGESGAAYGAISTPLPGDTQSHPMLTASYQSERGSSIEEQEWRDDANKRVALFEVWYRVWSRVLVIRSPDGRVVEYDANNDAHTLAVSGGLVKPEYAIVSKVHLSWWLGPHKLADSPSPYKHNRFPYVPFWHKREDRTGVPYGLARGWMYLQDTINSTLSKLRWGLSAIRTTRTDGACVDDDATVRREVARSDADIVLVKDFTAKQHVFKVERDFPLTDQQNNMLNDSREAIKRVSAINSSYMGEASQARSGLADAGLVDQAALGQGELFDNFQGSRNEVGELLLSLIVEDMTGVQSTVKLPGTITAEPRQVTLNAPHPDGYLTNDVSRTMMKVTLEDVPSSPSYRGQQLAAMSEAYKSIPENLQTALAPQFVELMDLPHKAEAIAAIRQAMQQPTPQQIQQQQDQAVQAALAKAGTDHKAAVLAQDAPLKAAQVRKLDADAVSTGTLAAFQAMEAGGLIVASPQLAPIGDEILKGAGYIPPTPAGVDPNIASALPQNVPAGINPIPPAPNTHPNFPPRPLSPALGARMGIEGGQQP